MGYTIIFILSQHFQRMPIPMLIPIIHIIALFQLNFPIIFYMMLILKIRRGIIPPQKIVLSSPGKKLLLSILKTYKLLFLNLKHFLVNIPFKIHHFFLLKTLGPWQIFAYNAIFSCIILLLLLFTGFVEIFIRFCCRNYLNFPIIFIFLSPPHFRYPFHYKRIPFLPIIIVFFLYLHIFMVVPWLQLDSL